MTVRPLDTLLAIKALTVAPGLKHSDRRIGTVLIEHFNRKTGQCDPGLERIAALAQYSVRTVIRAADRLVAAGLFRKDRHGGHLNRNHYEPNWSRLRAAAAEWDRSLLKRNATTQRDRESHLSADSGVTQTCSSNLEKEAGGKEGPPKAARSRPSSRSSGLAAASAAERRWTGAIHNAFSRSPDVYASVIAAVDEPLRAEATHAEVRKRGGGFALIVDTLKQQLVLPKVGATDG